MTVKEAQRRLLTGMTPSMEGIGFDYDEQEFKRKIQGGSQRFYLRVTQRANEIVVEPWWCIRLDGIVDIYHLVTLKKEEYFHYTCVFENNLGRLLYYLDQSQGPEIKDLKYVVRNIQDLETLIKVIPIRFKQYLLPYLDANSTIERADALLNEDPRNLSPHNWVYPYKATMGLIAARLVKNPRYYELVRIYEEELAEANPINKEEFQKLKELLEAY